MSEQEKPAEWDSLWQEYTKALENWKKLFDQVQQASNEMREKFNDVWEKAIKESSNDTMKLFAENWQKSLNDAGIKSYKEFAENWQKSFTDSGMEQMKAYGEMLKKFADTWNSMWPKKS